MKEHGMQGQYSRHAREGGHPVRGAAATDHQRFGILDHPPEPVIGRRLAPTRWRMMTVERETDEIANGDI
jgi:hypothetical protein